MKKLAICITAIYFFAFTKGIGQDTRKIVADVSASSIMYAMSHPLHNFEATSKEFKAVAAYNMASKKIELIAVTAAIKSFDSGNSNRDSHMIEATEALKYPNVTFSGNEISYSGEKISAKGKLTFHGVSKPFTITGVQKLTDKKMVVTGSFDVNMTDFGIKPPSLMGLSTDEEIKMKYTLTFSIE